ncbi:protein TALPID3%2C partial [Scomber scombrus]|uniref:Protein TALPID3, partial n=1 Tax=Scomber scombrus TaxID=13677 RepID=A0AAV1QME8_SCOSC
MEMLLRPEESLNTTPAQDPHQTQQDPHQTQENLQESQQSQSQSQQNRHQTQQDPHQTLQNPHQTLQNPHQTLQNPHQTQQDPHQTLQNPHQTLQNPHQTLQDPHQTQQDPHQTQQDPHQTLQDPHQTLQNPHQTLQDPHQTLQNPHQTQQDPHQTQQHQSISQQKHYRTQQKHHRTQQNLQETQQSQSHSQQNHHHSHQSHQFRPVLVQRRPAARSQLEEAGLVLRRVQRQKKVLEENLDSLLRAKTGEVLHCQLEALAANRDWTEEVRIKKTVDAWINTLSKDIMAEMSSEDAAGAAGAAVAAGTAGAAVALQQRAAGSRSSAHSGRKRPGALEEAEPEGDAEPVEGESYLTRLYGRAPYDGLRRTLKKSPYLRFSSPASPLGRKSRPRLVESVRGVKVKSCKTQTSLAPPGRPPSHYIFSSSQLTSRDPSDLAVTPADTHSVPMAIPLGRPRMDSSSRRRPTEPQQEVTSPPTAVAPVAVVTVDPETPEQLSQLDAVGSPPPPLPPLPPPSHTVDITERKSEEEEDEEEDEEDVLPGNEFLCVAEVVQEEVSVEAEEALELDGGPSPPPVLYQGPVFPPQAPSALPAQDQISVPGHDLQRDALEDRMVEWVEQQLMSRMISEMYRPPLADPAQNDSTDQSELEEQSFTSDIGEN